MGEKLLLKFKLLTGHVETIEISQNASVLDAKRQLHTKQPYAPPYRQKLFIDYHRAGSGTLLQDDHTLSSYSSIKSGCTIVLIIKPPWIIYVHDPHGKIYEIDIPSSDPMSYTISDLKALVEQKMKQTLSEYQFQFKGEPIEVCRHGKQLTLKHWEIKKEDTVFVMKTGILLDITSPQIDICFLVDCTGSMASWIESVKNNVKNVSDSLEKQYRGCDLQFAFVRYTDYDLPESSRTTWIDFTKSLSHFHGFVGNIIANGGGDGPEDIMGGLNVTFSNLIWRPSAAKVLIHIADAPCHGKQYHSGGDTYPNGDPAGITHDQMMNEVVHLDIQYWFAYINQSSTNQMIGIFNDCLKMKSNHRLIIRQIDATKPEQLADAVHKSVTASVFANEAKKGTPHSSSGTFDTSEPNWALFVPQHGLKTTPPGPKSLQNLQDGFKPRNTSISFSVKIASNPFTDGEESLVYRGYDTRNYRKVVLKRFKSADSTLDCHMKVLEIQTIASTYANEFNIHKQKPSHLETLEFIPVDVAQMTDGSLYIVQLFVDGKFEKFNNNSGIVCTALSSSELMQAFSHFTFVHSGESLLICDLQGARNGNMFQLIDPAIHYRFRSGYYGSTDHGFVGIKRFFKSHTCNSICCQMGLEGTQT